MWIRVTDYVKVIRSIELDTYEGMTPEEAAEYERTMDQGEKIEAVVTELETRPPASFVRIVEIVRPAGEFDAGEDLGGAAHLDFAEDRARAARDQEVHNFDAYGVSGYEL